MQVITGKCKPNQGRRVVQLMEEVQRLRQKFASSEATLVGRSDIKFAFKLAREAIVSLTSSTDVKTTQGEICVICLEETDAERMFFIDECLHRH